MNSNNIVREVSRNELKKYIIKASFKDCPIADRERFLNSSCLIPISVGQKVHEGEKFKATVQLIDRSFRDANFLIDDTIQRYTLAIDSGRNENEEFGTALQLGDEWINRNISLIKGMTIPIKILRWEDFKANKNYVNKKQMIEESYLNNSAYSFEIDETIKEFLYRYQQNKRCLNEDDYKRAYLLCLDYLKEECACMCLWAEKYYNFELYPTGRNRAMKATHENFIKQSYNNVLNSVSIRFKKYYSSNVVTPQSGLEVGVS